jgi:hypothetical protein
MIYHYRKSKETIAYVTAHLHVHTILATLNLVRLEKNKYFASILDCKSCISSQYLSLHAPGLYFIQHLSNFTVKKTKVNFLSGKEFSIKKWQKVANIHCYRMHSLLPHLRRRER